MSNQMSDALAALEAVEILPAKPINLPAAAMYYVTKLRWPVFPLKPRGKTPLTPNGFKDATLDAEQVRRWWTQHPEANIGVPTGPRTLGIGLDVIDADGPAGVAAWNRLKHRRCPPDCSSEAFCGADGGFRIVAEAFTPGNSSVGRGPGRHVFIPASGRGNAARLHGQPLDRRGAGGYVVAVPSVNLVGSAYAWITPPKPPEPSS
jgi:hypothetical protein